MPEPFKGHKMKLREPIQNGAELISELEIRKPKAKDIRPMPQPAGTSDVLNLAGRLCACPPSVIDELCMEDTMELLEIVGDFMQPGQKTGDKV